MKIKCIIVDDEPISRDIIRRYLSKYGDFEVLCEATNAFEALKFVDKIPIDVVFLDINMPKLSGLSLVKELTPVPTIVFITAYPEFAVQGFELEALDYLVKPVNPTRFAETIAKIRKKVHRENTDGHLLVKTDRKVFKVLLSEILYLKSSGDYVHIIREGKSLITHDSLKNMERVLPPDRFVRAHKSFIVNLDYVKAFEAGKISINGINIPIGNTYKASIKEKMLL